MGLRTRMRAKPVSRTTIDTHNRHDPKASWHKLRQERQKAEDKRWREDAAEAFRRG